MQVNALAQGEDGIAPFSAWDGEVNLANQNLLLNIDVRTKSGPIPFHYHLVANNYAKQNIGGYAWWSINPSFVGQFDGKGTISKTSSPDTCGDGTHTGVKSNWKFTDPSGNAHPFNDALTDSQGCLYGLTYTGPSSDGTGLTIVITGATNATVYAPDG